MPPLFGERVERCDPRVGAATTLGWNLRTPSALSFKLNDYSGWYELERCEDSLRFLEAFDPLLRALCVVFLCVRRCDCVAQARAADGLGPDRDFEVIDLNRSVRFFTESLEPAGWLVIPGARKDSVLDDHDPDTRVAMLSSGANAHDLRLTCRFDDFVSKRCVL